MSKQKSSLFLCGNIQNRERRGVGGLHSGWLSVFSHLDMFLVLLSSALCFVSLMGKALFDLVP